MLKQFQKLYHKEIIAIQKQISNLPKDKHDLKNIINVLDESLGEKFPKKVADVLRPYLTTIWKDAGGHVWQDKDEHEKAKKAAEQLAAQYLPQLENNLVHGFQKSYNEKLTTGESRRDYFLQVIKNELEGKGTSPQKGIAIVESIATEMGKAFTKKQLFNAYRIGVSLGVMRHRNFSQVLSMEAVGYRFVEVVAIMDNKTSPICRTMNGRRIDMGTATSYAKRFLKTEEPKKEPKKIKKFTLVLDKPPVPYALGYVKFAEWEDPKDFTPEKTSGKSSKDIVAGMKSQLPPYHPNCRTTVVPGMPERVVNRRGREFLWEKRNKPKFSYTENHRIRRVKDTIEQCTREYSLLSTDEFAAKMNAARQAKWREDLIEEKFDGHWREFDDIDFSDRNHDFKEYRKKTKAILDGNFDSVYIYKRRKHGRFMFYEEATSTGVFVDTNENMVVNMYRIEEDVKVAYDDEYIRIDGK